MSKSCLFQTSARRLTAGGHHHHPGLLSFMTVPKRVHPVLDRWLLADGSVRSRPMPMKAADALVIGVSRACALYVRPTTSKSVSLAALTWCPRSWNFNQQEEDHREGTRVLWSCLLCWFPSAPVFLFKTTRTKSGSFHRDGCRQTHFKLVLCGTTRVGQDHHHDTGNVPWRRDRSKEQGTSFYERQEGTPSEVVGQVSVLLT